MDYQPSHPFRPSGSRALCQLTDLELQVVRAVDEKERQQPNEKPPSTKE
jgi:hypothetical protein